MGEMGLEDGAEVFIQRRESENGWRARRSPTDESTADRKRC